MTHRGMGSSESSRERRGKHITEQISEIGNVGAEGEQSAQTLTSFVRRRHLSERILSQCA